jgi:hypothetical protein
MVGVDAGANSHPMATRLAISRRAALVIGAILGANAITQAIRGLLTVGAGRSIDFVAFAGASRLFVQGSQCLYCSGPLHAVESAYLGVPRPAFVAFLNPPIVALVMAPLAELSRTLGLGVFLVLSLLAIGIGGWLLMTRLRCPTWASVLAVLSLPAAWAVAEGQWDPFLFLALIAALVVLERHPVLAGCLLSVLAIKIQAVWLVPVALVALRRWRVLLGLGAGAAILAGTTLAILGSHWMDWPRALLQAGTAQEVGALGLVGIAASLWGSVAGFVGFVIAAAVAIATTLELRRRLRDDPGLAIAAAVFVSLLLAPHFFVTDFLLLAPALALAGRRLPLASAVAATILSVAYFVGTLPSTLLDLDAYVPALAVCAVVVLIVVVRPASRWSAAPAAPT